MFHPDAAFGSSSDRAIFRMAMGDLEGSRAVSPTFKLSTPEASSMLEGLVQANLSSMGRAGGSAKAMPILNGIQKGTVRYVRADPNEHWKTWREIIDQLGRTGRGEGDCEDLASAVAAELRFNGIPARTYVYKSGPKLYHVVVKTGRWGLMDPSRAAGMEGNG